MPFRIARAFRAHFASAYRTQDGRRRRGSRSAAEPLEGRTLLSATTGPNLITPFMHDSEWDKVGLVADFTADAMPTAVVASYGDGSADDLTQGMLEYDPAARRGTAYALHRFAQPGNYPVTLTITGADGWVTSESFTAIAVIRSDTPAGTDTDSQTPDGAVAKDEFSGFDSAGSVSAEAGSLGPPQVDAVFVGSTAWTTGRPETTGTLGFKDYLQQQGLGTPVWLRDPGCGTTQGAAVEQHQPGERPLHRGRCRRAGRSRGARRRRRRLPGDCIHV